MSNPEALGLAELHHTLLKAQARITELMLENEQLNGHKEHLISNARDKSQQLESERRIHVQEIPKGSNSELAHNIQNLQDVNKLLIEELCLVALETGIDANMFLNYKTHQFDNLIEYNMYDESTLMINTPPSTTLSGIPHCQ